MVELTEHECIVYIEKKTGKQLGKDFGFIAGMHHPFQVLGFQSATKNPGYEVWHKVGDKVYRLNAYPDTQENTLNYIVNFINLNLSSVAPEDFVDYIVKEKEVFPIKTE